MMNGKFVSIVGAALVLMISGCQTDRSAVRTAPAIPQEPASAIKWNKFTATTSVEVEAKSVNRSIIISGEMAFPPDVYTISVAPNAQILEALDEKGDPIMAPIIQGLQAGSAEYVPNFRSDYYGSGYGNSLLPRIPTGQFTAVMNSLDHLPKEISFLSGNVYYQKVKEEAVKELDVASLLEYYVEVVPGFGVKYRTEKRPDPPPVDPNNPPQPRPVQVNLSYQRNVQLDNPQERLTPPLLMNFQALDGKGSLLRIDNLRSDRDYNNQPGGMLLQAQVYLLPDQEIAKIRLTIMLSTETVKVPFVLKDIRLP